MKRKESRKALVRNADKWFSRYILARDGRRCFVCGGIASQAGHLFSRVNQSTRWDEQNAQAVCPGCNLRHEYDFEPHRKKFVLTFGDEIYDNLYTRHRNIVKYSNADLRDIAEEYREKAQELEGVN